MKHLFFILGLFSVFYIGCKKDTKVEPTNSGPSERYKMITSHYWRLEAHWEDTSVYGKAHPDEIPLSTSVDINTFTDSCNYYTCSKFASNGWCYSVKPYGCGGCGLMPSCEVSTGMPWSLSSDEKTFNGPAVIDNILLINDTVFKLYNYQIYNFTKQLVRVKVFKSHVYK